MWRIAARTSAVGLEILLSIVIGLYGGKWLDAKLGISPWLTYIGLAAGIGAAIKALVRVTRSYRKMAEENNTTTTTTTPTTTTTTTTTTGKKDDGPRN